MNVAEIRDRATVLLDTLAGPDSPSDAEVSELHQGAISVLRALYGEHSLQEEALTRSLVEVGKKGDPLGRAVPYARRGMLKGALKNVVSEIDAGFLGTLRGAITAEFLTDLVKLSRESLGESDDGAKNVAAVLAAAAFEDTIRRFATLKGIAQEGRKLADLLTDLKDAEAIEGAQVSIAQSFLRFRNDALHAQWDEIERAGIESVLSFTEQLVLKNFQ